MPPWCLVICVALALPLVTCPLSKDAVCSSSIANQILGLATSLSCVVPQCDVLHHTDAYAVTSEPAKHAEITYYGAATTR